MAKTIHERYSLQCCDGNKLKPESLAVKINKKGIMDVCDMSIDHCYDFFSTLKLTDNRAIHCKRCSKRNQRTS